MPFRARKICFRDRNILSPIVVIILCMAEIILAFLMKRAPLLGIETPYITLVSISLINFCLGIKVSEKFLIDCREEVVENGIIYVVYRDSNYTSKSKKKKTKRIRFKGNLILAGVALILGVTLRLSYSVSFKEWLYAISFLCLALLIIAHRVVYRRGKTIPIE